VRWVFPTGVSCTPGLMALLHVSQTCNDIPANIRWSVMAPRVEAFGPALAAFAQPRCAGVSSGCRWGGGYLLR